MTREEILSIAYSIGTVGEPWWLDDEDLMAFVRAIAPRLALTPGEPVGEQLRIAGLTLIGLAEHDQNCEVFDLDDEGRHRACTCGLDDAIAVITQAGKSATPQTQPMPPWISYDAATDVLTIHGKRYSAAMFGEDGFLAPPGTMLRVEQGQPDCVTLTTVQPQPKQEPVAWMIWTHGPVKVFMNKDEAEMEFDRLCRAYPEQSRKLTPLYTAPQPQPKQEPVAWIVTAEMQDGTHRTHPLSGRYKDVLDCCDVGEPIPLYTAPPPQRDDTSRPSQARRVEALLRENEDLKRQIESMHYDLDAMSAIKEERDECYVVMRQALEALEACNPYPAASEATRNNAIAAMKERLK